jgi:hypothetical protein
LKLNIDAYIKVCNEAYIKVCNEAYKRYLFEVKKIPVADQTKEKCMELQRHYFFSVVNENDIILPGPKHINEDINKLIERYCVEIHQNDYGETVYSGGNVGAIVCNNFNKPRLNLPKSAEFSFVEEFCNGYRETWVSMKDKVELTICEGDLSIVIYDNVGSLINALYRAAEYYGTSFNKSNIYSLFK